MSLGAIALRLRQRFGKGLGVAYYRDIVRPRILRSPPVTNTADRRCEIHVLTSDADWLNLIWTLKSFYAASQRSFALCIHEDGTLDETAIASLQDHFPEARIVLRSEADKAAEHLLADHPACLSFRRKNLLAPKVFDFMARLEGDRMALFDSDLLFFRAPEAYLDLIDDPDLSVNAFNEDVSNSYAIGDDAILAAGLELVPRINSGLGIVQQGSLPLDWIEEFLHIPGLAQGHFWRIEQTLFALCSMRFGVRLLPPEYRVYLKRGLGGRPMRHYVGAVRHLMYSEGMRALSPQLAR